MKEITKIYKFRSFIEQLNNETPKNNYSRTYKKDSDTFCNETWDEALKLARYGVKNQTNIEKIVHTMSLLEHVKTKTFGMAEHGLCVDVGTYLTGEPECWIAEKFDYKPKKVVKILASIGCPWYINTKQIENRGAGIISLIQMLKKQGYIVKINIYESSIYNGNQYTCFIKIPTNPLDIQSLSYVICSPTFLRRFLFAWLENITHKQNCQDDNYGRPNSIDEVAISKDIIHFKGIGDEDCSYNSEEETKNHIISIFDEFLKLNNETRIK